MTRDPTADEWLERRLAIIAARKRGDEQYLLGALLDPDHRNLAAKFLGELGAVEASEPLLRLLDAADPYVRATAAEVLGQLGAEEALPRLRQLALHDEDVMVRAWAVGALGDIGDSDGVDMIVALLHDSSRRVRGAAALALGRLGDASFHGGARPTRSSGRALRVVFAEPSEINASPAAIQGTFARTFAHLK